VDWIGEFVKYPHNPVLSGTSGAWDSQSVRQNGLFKRDDIYYLYYAGEPAPGEHWQIGLATSHDMLHWEKYAGNPILPRGRGGSWDCFFTMYGKVIEKDGLYYMVYMGADGTINSYNMQLGLAISDDLYHWEKYQANPILRKGERGEWDSRGVWDHSLLFYQSHYYLSFGGNDVIDGQGSIGIATSEDLVHWQKYAGNPVVSGRLECTELFKYCGQAHMLFVYWDAPYPKGIQTIGLMSSEDMVHWVECPRKALLTAKAEWERIGVDDPASGVGSPAVIVEGSKLRMIYHGGSHSNWCDGYAEATILHTMACRLPE
jgi:predicted GH43/DUF377 family glycosyl hydrolase